MLQPTNILTPKQVLFLELFNKSPFVHAFYLSGGTALCGFYIPYRYSDDLDFFSIEEFDAQEILFWLKSVKNQLGFTALDIQTSFNRNLIFLEFNDEILKTEFTYYPFTTKHSEMYKKIRIDSIEDIALNKLFTIYQNPRLRDYMDLYMIMQKEKYSFSQLSRDARIKFDWHIDPVQLGSRLLQVKVRKDVPSAIDHFDFEGMEKFYLGIARELGSKILE